MKAIALCLILLALVTPSLSYELTDYIKSTIDGSLGWAAPWNFKGCMDIYS